MCDEDGALGRPGYPRTGRQRTTQPEGRGWREEKTSTTDENAENGVATRGSEHVRAARQMAGFAGGTQYATEFRGRMLLLLVPLLCLAVLVLLQLQVC